MSVGKVASLALIAVTGWVAAVVHWVVDALHLIDSVNLVVTSMIFGTVAAVAVGLVLFPIGHAFDRSVAAVRAYIEGSAQHDRTTIYRGSKWLEPITRAFMGAVDQFQEQEQLLRSQMRDLEISCRVAEAQRRQIEVVLHALRDPVVVTDAFNEVVMANDAAARELQFELEDALHAPISALVSDPDLCRIIGDVRENGVVGQQRHVEHDLALRGAGEDDRKPVFDVCLSCVEDHRHEIAGVVTILHDMTRERELSQMKTDFVSKASHELRTPLSSIRAYVEMLVDGEAVDESSRQEFYRIIYNETDRLGRLIDNMLNISRIEAGIIQVDREEIDVKGLINKAANSIEPQAREKNIAISTKLSDVGLTVEGDADMLYQAVLNLVSNAVKYTPEGGRVTVAADSDNLTRSVVVTVSDTGLGIPPDALPKLFDKFFRVENYKRVAKGTGLGLSLCKHIVETVHRGQIGVESELGMGSKFWFTIPMRYAGTQIAA